MQEIRQQLVKLFRSRSLQIGDFRLTSGLRSNYYFDAKQTTLHPEGSYLSAKLILEQLRQKSIKAHAIGGLTLGADPIVAAVAAVSFAERDRYSPISGLIVRKEPKSHGTQTYLEGCDGSSGSRVVVVDDVCTTGKSTRLAIDRLEKGGYEVVAVIALVDREQGGKENLKDYQFLPLLTATELLDSPEIQEQLDQVK